MQFFILFTGVMLFVFYQAEKQPISFNQEVIAQVLNSDQSDKGEKLMLQFDEIQNEKNALVKSSGLDKMDEIDRLQIDQASIKSEFNALSESINIEFESTYDFENIKKLLQNAPGCKVIDELKDGGYITPLEAEGNHTTYISRIRKDNSNSQAINLWVVSDNLLKGAALNTVQIAESLMKKFKLN